MAVSALKPNAMLKTNGTERCRNKQGSLPE
jgi:hypothetical protein